MDGRYIVKIRERRGFFLLFIFGKGECLSLIKGGDLLPPLPD